MNPFREFVQSGELEHKRQTTQFPSFRESSLRAIAVLTPPGFAISQSEAANLYKLYNTSWSGVQPVHVFCENDAVGFLESEFAQKHSPFLAVVQLADLLAPPRNERIPLKLISFFRPISPNTTKPEVMVPKGPISLTADTEEHAFVPGGDFKPGGNIDLSCQEDYAAVMAIVSSCHGPDIVEFYPTVCEIHTNQNPKTFFFFKFPKNTYELAKRTPVTLFALECYLEETAPVIAVRVEFINQQFKTDLYREFAALRQCAGKTVQFEPPEPVYSEGVLNPMSERDWRRMSELEKQDTWLQVIAPSDFSDVLFIETSVGPQMMTVAMAHAEEYLKQLPASEVNFDAAYQSFTQSAPRPNLSIYGCFEDYVCGGKLLLEDGAEFQSELHRWVFDHLHIGEAFTDWP